MFEARREEFGSQVGDFRPDFEMSKRRLHGDHGPNVVETRRLSVARTTEQIAKESKFDGPKLASWVGRQRTGEMLEQGLIAFNAKEGKDTWTEGWQDKQVKPRP